MLLSLLFFLSPASEFFVLGYGVGFAFGLVGVYFLLPFLFFLGCLLLFRGSLKGKILDWRFYLGMGLLLVSLLLLSSTIAISATKVQSQSQFLSYFDDYYKRNYSLYGASELGGGFLGYLLASSLGGVSPALPLTIGIVLVIFSLALAFYSPLSRLYRSLALKASHKKSLAASKKAVEPILKEKEEGKEAPLENIGGSYFSYDDNPESESPLPDTHSAPKAEKPSLSTPDEEGDALNYSRVDKYSEKPSSLVPQDIPTPEAFKKPAPSPSKMETSGLTEAVFAGDDETPLTDAKSLFNPVETSLGLAPAETPHSNEIPVKKEKPEPSPKPIEEEKPAAPSFENEIKFEDIAKLDPIPVMAEASAPSLTYEVTSVSPVGEPREKPADSIGEAPVERITPQEQSSEPSLEPEEPSPIMGSEPSNLLEKAAPLAPAPEPEVKIEPASAPAPSPIGLPEKNVDLIFSAAPAPVSPSAPAPAPKESPSNLAPAPETKISPFLALGQAPEKKRPPYVFPSLDLLKTYPENSDQSENVRLCEERVSIINEVLHNLNAGANVVSYTIGPAVTQYDIQTDPDVSVKNVSRYIQDISIHLQGIQARFAEIVPGKTTSGLEIANSTTTTVSFKEMASALPEGGKNNLLIPFGKSITDEPIFADLSKFPHLLVSGATGSGKSIFVHGIIMSLIMRNRPEDLKLILVDPKRVEFSKYRDIPHLLCPIIKDPAEAGVALDKLIAEMERRYSLFEAGEVSDIRQFNSIVAPREHVEKLPFIVCIIDEYADLVDTNKNISDPVVRLAQKARAAGIHLVIATQRPSTNVITGVIKANLPVRVALMVASSIDSQTILGYGGAEELIGHGDMLVDCANISRSLIRCQGCFCDNEEIQKVCDFIRAESKVDYDPEFLDLRDHSNDSPSDSGPSAHDIKIKEGEDFYEQVKEEIMTQDYTSISKIQRMFSVGFPRAGKLFNQLQSDGIVAKAPDSASSSKGCRVLVHNAEPDSVNPGSTECSSVDNTHFF